MKMLAYVLAIICVAAAAMYFLLPAGSLPSFVPGFEAGSTRVHIKHGIAAAVVAAILLVAGWWAGRSQR